jgi:hypothetical protein
MNILVYILAINWLLSIIFALMVIIVAYINRADELYDSGNNLMKFSILTGYVTFIPMLILFIKGYNIEREKMRKENED